jgi:hypothetical protein
MKQANNTEMDRLLQRHARRWNAAGATAGESDGGDDAVAMNEAGAHLDADELNVYAEGALPPAARARYASHLADCRSCRATVTNLTLAAHEAAEERASAAPESASPSKSWWSAIAALFAPPVLRYAVPAIMLLGVIVVALVATRDRSEPQFVAQNQEKQADNDVGSERAAPETSASQISPGESADAANSSATPTETTKRDATSETTPSDGILRSNANTGQISSATANEPTPAQASDADDSPQRRERALDDELYATEPKPAPAPPVTTSRPAAPSAGKVEEARQDREQDAAATGANTETADLGRASTSSSRKEAEAKDKSSAAGEDAARQGGASQTGARAMTRKAAKSPAANRADDNKDASNSTETRSVAGRRFRRQGNAWIDTAYSSSRSTINVARGSDQYRALAADEPGLRSIAEQLGGEVIIVWKGKAYRIY